jgi:hypothetical protein
MRKPKDPTPEQRVARAAEYVARKGFFNVTADLWQALADIEARKPKRKHTR